uniref:Uncharacterized protein n=1 Tax=Anguilla anguilla TaxID=7936 RepID=A0A0E9PVZ2_ANGAN
MRNIWPCDWLSLHKCFCMLNGLADEGSGISLYTFTSLQDNSSTGSHFVTALA